MEIDRGKYKVEGLGFGRDREGISGDQNRSR